MARQATNRLLQMLEEGILDKDNVILACLNYMSEDEVADMCHDNGYFEHEPDEDDDEEDLDEIVEALESGELDPDIT